MILFWKPLAKEIIDEIGGDTFVIKPRSSFFGNGVIIVDKEELDQALKIMIVGGYKLSQIYDKACNCVEDRKNQHESFLFYVKSITKHIILCERGILYFRLIKRSVYSFTF